MTVQSESLEVLISQNKNQRLNAIAASNVQKQNSKNWRVHGSAENWEFFENTIESMENRLRQFTIATDSIKEAVESFQKDTLPSPAVIGEVMNRQRNMYLSLAGRVAELHQEADRVVKRRKLN